MNKIVQPQWLEWTKELQFIAQGGLTYSKDVFDIERFERIREITAEMLSLQSEIPIEKVKNLFCNETGFQTPKLDTRAAIFKDDKILLVKEKNGTWSLPGGWVDINQSIKTNTEKEVKEEAGLNVKAIRIIEICIIFLPMPTMFVKFLFFVRLKADISDPILKRMRVPISDWKNYLFLQKRKITKNKLKCALQLTTIETGKYYLTNKSNT